MRSYFLFALAWSGCAVATAPVAQAAVPLEVYGRLPSLEDMALSPDGSRLAFVRTTQNQRLVVVISLTDHKSLGALKVGEEKLRGLEWADNSNLLIKTSATALPFGFIGKEQEWYMLQVYAVDRHKVIPVPDPTRFRGSFSFMNVVSGRVMVRHVDGHTTLFIPGAYVEGGALRALVSVDLATLRESVVIRGSAATRQWLVDAGGEVVAEQDYDEHGQRWILKIRRAGRLQEAVSGRAAIDFPSVLGFGPNADSLLVQAVEDEDPVWRLLSLRDGTLSAPMAERKELDAPIEDHRTYRMIGGVHAGDDARYVFFDPTLQQRWDSVMSAFAGERLRLVSWSDDFRKLVVQVDGTQHGYAYELVDLSAHTASPIGDVYEGGTPPFEVRRVSYAAKDGLSIPAYLTLPRGRLPKNLPLVVLPHGGPAAHDAARFAWWPQALAGQNYAVLQPNYRGSDLSRRFLAAGFGEWGRKMQTDLSDGVRYLVKEGIVDPSRVCIVGASYGGYAALAGVTLDPLVYRCAVAVAGISDLGQMLSWVNDRHFHRNTWEQRYWERFMGASGPADPALDAVSPIKHIDALHVPLLVIHGRDDTIVPFEQSSMMVDAVRRAGKEVDFLALQHEDHWLSRSETRLQMLKAAVDFLRAHNPPD